VRYRFARGLSALAEVVVEGGTYGAVRQVRSGQRRDVAGYDGRGETRRFIHCD
jgi:hypothetical protein